MNIDINNLLSTCIGGVFAILGGYFVANYQKKKEIEFFKKTKLEELFSLLVEYAKYIKTIQEVGLNLTEQDFNKIPLIIRLYFPCLKEDWQIISQNIYKKDYEESIKLMSNFLNKIEKESKKIIN